MKKFEPGEPFVLENGSVLHGLTIAYHTYGKMNRDKTNVVWVCHALTANSDAVHWWHGLIGSNHLVDPAEYFIVCANILGSCYGTTGPLSIDPHTGQPYYGNFPHITIRDMVQAHILLRKHLGIELIYLIMGGSMGGYQALEWSIFEKARIRNLFIIGTSPTESAWGIAIHTTQRLAIEADASWMLPENNAGAKGLKAARAIGMLTYRNYGILKQKQSETDPEKTDGFRASSYINYQGDKLVARFNAYSYWVLTKSMDSHHIARGRGGDVDRILNSISQRTLIIGINSDILCPLEEQRHLHACMPNSTLVEIDSAYGHDGFLVESEKIAACLAQWLKVGE